MQTALQKADPKAVRPARKADYASLLRLWNRSARYDPLTPALLAEKLGADPDDDPETTLLADSPNGPAGFVNAVLRRRTHEPAAGYIKLIAVAPEKQRTRIGSLLLRRAEERLAARGARTLRIGESAPNYLTPGVDRRYAGALRFFEMHGYGPSGEAHNMTVYLRDKRFPVGAEESALAARGIELRRARTADEESVMRFLAEHWPSWQAEVQRSLGNDPPALHLAFRSGRLLAFAARDGNNVGTGWFGPMGTAPEARGLGIGRVLMWRCLHDIRDQGHAVATIPWVGPTGFYARHASAEVSRTFQRFEKVLEP